MVFMFVEFLTVIDKDRLEILVYDIIRAPLAEVLPWKLLYQGSLLEMEA